MRYEAESTFGFLSQEFGGDLWVIFGSRPVFEENLKFLRDLGRAGGNFGENARVLDGFAGVDAEVDASF